MSEGDDDHTHEELVRLETALETFVEGQRETNKAFTEFLTNHWPHLAAQVGKLEGRMTMLVWGVGAMLGLLSGILARLLVGG